MFHHRATNSARLGASQEPNALPKHKPWDAAALASRGCRRPQPCGESSTTATMGVLFAGGPDLLFGAAPPLRLQGQALGTVDIHDEGDSGTGEEVIQG
jgi:hypothetical protein